MTLDFETISKAYLSELQAQSKESEHSGQLTPELSYKPVLDKYLRNVAELIDPDIVVVFEPKTQAKAGHPDWRFHNARSLGIYGYVEGKPINSEISLSIGNFEEQVSRYYDLGHRLIVTDGLEFYFYAPPREEPKRILIVEKPVTAVDWNSLQPNPLLEARFKQFFEAAAPRQISEDELVKTAARIAKELSKNVSELSEIPIGAGLNEHENRTIKVLHELKAIVENHHDLRLRDRKAFSDFVAQVLIFGLLYSQRVIEEPHLSPAERYDKIERFWSDAVYQDFTEKLRPFRALIEVLNDELHSLGPIGTWYQDCCLLLAYIQLDQTQTAVPDYHKLYEKFLSIFDPKTRFDFGAFYTPRELARYSVKLVQSIVECELGGFSLYAEGNKLIDPCCGTGTFLEQLILGSEQSNKPKIIGFEILPAPYALAHYRIGMLRQNHILPNNLSIMLTNTLSDDLEREYEQVESLTLVQEEQAIARELSRPPLTLIIGNPPSSDSSVQSPAFNLRIVETLVEDFRPPLHERSTRQNIQKQLQNEFVRFLRWACNKLLSKPPGILAFVLPSSFAEQGSYRFARRWLALNFPKLWVLDIDKDARTGAQSNSIFNTLQGRLLLIGFTGMPGDSTETCQVKYGTIADLDRWEKLEELSRHRTPIEYLGMFAPLTIDQSTYIFRPVKLFDTQSYAKYWPLYPQHHEPEHGESFIFERHCSGVKLAPSSMFVHANKALLTRKLRDISDLSLRIDEIKARWFSQQDRPPADEKLSETVRSKVGELMENDGNHIIHYSYRPFTTVSALVSESLLRELASVGGGGTRYRPEVLSAFKNTTTIGIAVAPAPKDLGEKLHRFVSFCWNLPDNDLCRRGNAHVFCNQFPQYKKKRGDWDSEPFTNINPMLIEKLGAFLQVTTDEIVFYVYGILCSDAFLEKFEGALFRVASAEQRPRIPIPADASLFRSIASKGKILAELEKENSELQLTSEFEGFRTLFVDPFRLSSYKIDEDFERLDLLEDGGTVISIAPVSRAILRFEVSGYNVLTQWLKLRSHPYKRAEFTQEDYHELLRLLYSISEQIKTVADLDDEVEKLLSGEIDLLPCS